jgi:hypothetical protein
LHLYKDLIKGCLKAYDHTGESYVVHSPSTKASDKASPASTQDVATPPPLSSPSSLTTVSITSNRYVQPDEKPPELFGYPAHNNVPLKYEEPPQPAHVLGHVPVPIPREQNEPSGLPYVQYPTSYEESAFDPNSLYNPFPSVVPGVQHWDPNYTSAPNAPGQFVYASPQMEQRCWLGEFGDQYSQYLHSPYLPNPPRSLSKEEHVELMELLETTVMPDVRPHPQPLSDAFLKPYQ